MSNGSHLLDDVTIVIPTIGRDLLEGCLDSIAAGAAWPADLLVVDQSASEQVASWVAALEDRGMHVRHLPMRGRGIAAAMNHGLAQVHTPVTAVTHDDCRVRADWLSGISARVREWGGDVVVTGRVSPEGGYEVPSVIDDDSPAVYRRPLLNRDVLFPACMAFSTRLWRLVGPMDEDPLLRRASEDNEWAYRVLRAGIPIVYEPRVAVEHVAWRDADARAAVAWAYAHASGAFYGKYLRRAEPHFLLRAGLDLSHGTWMWLRGIAAREPVLAQQGRTAALGLLKGVAAGLSSGRPPLQTSRPTPPRR